MRADKWRGLRVFRNLCFVLLALLILWGQYRFPLPTPELRFRQLESRNLVDHSEIVYLWENPLSVKEASSGDPRHIVIGRYEDQYSVGYLYEPLQSNANVLEFWFAGEGPVPIPLYQSLLLEGKGSDRYSILALLQVPEETASAQVTITGRMGNMLSPVELKPHKNGFRMGLIIGGVCVAVLVLCLLIFLLGKKVVGEVESLQEVQRQEERQKEIPDEPETEVLPGYEEEDAFHE